MSHISYKDLPEVYVKHKDLKETFLAILGMITLVGGICAGFDVYFLLYGLHIHPRPLFGFLTSFGIILGMAVYVIPFFEKKWNMQDKSLSTLSSDDTTDRKESK